MLRRIVLAIVLLGAGLVPALSQSVTLLPNGEQQFADANGVPLAGGFVFFYVPGTTTPKATWQDPNATTLNSNPVVLDSAGRAIIYGSGEYRQVLQDQFHNTIWDQFTFGSNPIVLSSTPAGNVLGNPTTSSAAPVGVPVNYPLVMSVAQGLTFQESTTADNTSVTVTNQFDNTIRIATASITYNLPFSTNVVNGFGFTGYTNANTVTFQSQGTDTINGGSAAGSVTIPTQSLWTITTNGAGQWFVATSSQTNDAFAGEVIKMRTTSCPMGTLAEDGSAQSRTTYAALFGAIGTTWGAGDGSTTFNLPQAEGYFDRNYNPTGTGPDPSRTFAAVQAFSNGPISGNVSSSGTLLSFNSGSNSFGSGATGGPVTLSFSCTNCGSEARPVNNTVLSCIKTGL